MAERRAINRPNVKSPYLSEAIVHNGLIFCSGKIGLDAKTGALVSDDVGEQTVRIKKVHSFCRCRTESPVLEGSSGLA